MTTALDRRLRRELATTNELLIKSKCVIWCDAAEHVPVMIDLLIATGRLSESDRSHCVHWRALSSSAADFAKHVALITDADEMLERAGVRTRIGEAWKAHLQGPDALAAFWRDCFGELDAFDLDLLEQLERKAQKSRLREYSADGTAQPEACISRCK